MRVSEVLVTGFICLLGWIGPVAAKEKQTVTISYLLGPSRPLPEGLRAVAVIDSGVVAPDLKRDEREAKWSIMAADMIEAMLQAGSAMTSSPILVAKRSETQAVLREHDLALAGMVAGDQAARAGKLLAVQGLITSRIVVQIDEQRGTRSTLDWMSLMGGAINETLSPRPDPRPAPARPPVVQRRPPPEIRRTPDGRTYTVQRGPARTAVPPSYRGIPAQVYVPRRHRVPQRERSAAGGGLVIKTRDVEEISRHLTVQCSFTLIDAGTGQAIIQYSPPPFRKVDRRSPDFFFGSLLGEKDLDPVDHFIGELVEQATREFVSMIVPVEVSVAYELVARHDPAEQALRALRADDYAGAMGGFERELQEEPGEHETLFALGVVNELMGRPSQALEYYRKALAAEDVDDDELAIYAAAKDRLTAHLGRILPPVPAGSPQPAGSPLPAPLQTPPSSATPPPAVPAPAPSGNPQEPPPPIVEEDVIQRR